MHEFFFLSMTISRPKIFKRRRAEILSTQELRAQIFKTFYLKQQWRKTLQHSWKFFAGPETNFNFTFFSHYFVSARNFPRQNCNLIKKSVRLSLRKFRWCHREVTSKWFESERPSQKTFRNARLAFSKRCAR